MKKYFLAAGLMITLFTLLAQQKIDSVLVDYEKIGNHKAPF